MLYCCVKTNRNGIYRAIKSHIDLSYELNAVDNAIFEMISIFQAFILFAANNQVVRSCEETDNGRERKTSV